MIKASMIIIGLMATPITEDLPSMKDCMEQRVNILEQNDSLQVTCIPKESEVEKHREMFDLFIDVFEYIQVYQVEQCIAIAEETGEQCKWESNDE